VGAVTIAIAVAASLWLAPPRGGARARLLPLLGFIGFFLAQSLRAGFDVARLAFSPLARITPHGVEVSLTLPPGPPRYLLAGTLSLLPGTLSVQLDGERLLVHVLSGVGWTRDEVRTLEARIAHLFGLA
jgi:multicomponent Na+:H+ antiporter subunit E